MRRSRPSRPARMRCPAFCRHRCHVHRWVPRHGLEAGDDPLKPAGPGTLLPPAEPAGGTTAISWGRQKQCQFQVSFCSRPTFVPVV